MKTSLLDRAIEWWSPTRALRRETARMRIGNIRKVQALYDGATTGRRSYGWRVAGTDANTEIATARPRLRNISRDMVRNNPIAGRIVQVIRQNVVGAGIVPAVKSSSKARQERIRKLIARHLETTAFDVTGRLNLYGIQGLVMGGVVESGEMLVRRRWVSDRRLALPFQVHVLEPDYLDSTVDGVLLNGNVAINGIEYDVRTKKRVAYHLYDEHPGALRTAISQTTTRVPAADVIHVYRADRGGQERGVTWFHPVILRMRDLADFVDAQLMRQKIAACFAAFVTSDADPSLPPGFEKDQRTGHPLETMAPGMIEYLRNGEKVEFGDPPQVGDFDPYLRTSLREIATGVGITYESLTGDLSQVNYSSGRMGWIEFQRSIDDWRWNMLIPHLCTGIAEWTLEAIGIMAPGGIGEYDAIGWTPPRREMINPKEEVPTSRDTIRSGLNSWQDEVRTLGRDPEIVAAEIAEDQKLFDSLGIKLDSDGRFPMSRAVDDDPRKSTGSQQQIEGPANA